MGQPYFDLFCLRQHNKAMKIALYCATFALVACAEPPPPTGDISGHWYGQRWQGRSRVIWHTQITRDGDLEIEFRSCYNGELLSRQKEFGTARLVAGIYETMIEKVIFLDESQEEEEFREDEIQHNYRLIELNDELMSYADEESGESFDAVRVTADFALECPPATLAINTNPDGRTGRDAWIIRGDDSVPDPDSDLPTETPTIKQRAPGLDENLEKRSMKNET